MSTSRSAAAHIAALGHVFARCLATAPPGAHEGRPDLQGAQVNDISLEDYITVKQKSAIFVPHTAGRYQKKRFRKAQCPVVER